MKRWLLVFLLLSPLMQSVAQEFKIEIVDNLSRMNSNQTYRFTKDSLVITAVSDYGRSHVNYLERLLKEEEKKTLQVLLKKFPLDSVKAEYFMGYDQFKQIDAENFPRSIELNMEYGEKKVQSRATNAWVGLYARLFDALNPLLPAEVRIDFDKDKFNVFY
jgi:hypothetical protein